MGRRDSESISDWFERAIVANSVAAEQLQQMQSGDTEFNAQARKVINQRAENAAEDLAEALAAYNKQRTRGHPSNPGGNSDHSPRSPATLIEPPVRPEPPSTTVVVRFGARESGSGIGGPGVGGGVARWIG